jgi:hypothetical protein
MCNHLFLSQTQEIASKNMWFEEK